MRHTAAHQGFRHETVALTGRFQPFHSDHLELAHEALRLSRRLLIGITNPDARSLRALPDNRHRHLASANPFSYLERVRMIRAALEAASVAAQRFEIVPFPLETPEACATYIPRGTPQLVRVHSQWERTKARRLQEAGYPVLLLTRAEKRISASRIRAAIASSEPWESQVPPGVKEVLLEAGERALRERCAGQPRQGTPS